MAIFKRSHLFQTIILGILQPLIFQGCKHITINTIKDYFEGSRLRGHGPKSQYVTNIWIHLRRHSYTATQSFNCLFLDKIPKQNIGENPIRSSFSRNSATIHLKKSTRGSSLTTNSLPLFFLKSQKKHDQKWMSFLQILRKFPSSSHPPQ